MDDSQIIELFFARNEAAIAETEKKYGKLCFQIAHNILGDFEDVKECINDTYLSIWNTIPPARPNRFSAYLCKTARNLSLKRLEYNSAAKRNSNMTVSFTELEAVVPDNRFRPDISDEQIGEVISGFLEKQKADARNMFIRRYYFFDSISDIAARYRFTESKVKNMLYHTRNKLRDFLRKEGIAL